MPTLLTEGNLQIAISDAAGIVNWRKFDGPEHGLSHCMQAVDFIIELSDRYQFIEIKDPQHPQSSASDYGQRFNQGNIDQDFMYKYRDTFLYELAHGRADKPIHYLMLIALDTLKPADLQTRQRAMQSKLPQLDPEGRQWSRPIVKDCAVFNMDAWNRHLPQYPVTRTP